MSTALMNPHVGRGITRGPLTVFPVWSDETRRRDYTSHLEAATVNEDADSPQVGSLTVGNPTDKPLLLLQGQILVGGMQNRMIAQSTVIPSRTEAVVEVVCVESGRWGGSRTHALANLRGSTRVRSALSGVANPQGEVWGRVSELDARVGPNPTSSYTEHASRAEEQVRDLVHGLHPLPGQTGIIIGLAGQPVVAEIMDSSTTLAEQFDSIIRAAALDALWTPDIATPSRRARRFLQRAAATRADGTRPAGAAESASGRDDRIEVTTLTWRSRDVHTVVTNLRHEVVAA